MSKHCKCPTASWKPMNLWLWLTTHMDLQGSCALRKSKPQRCIWNILAGIKCTQTYMGLTEQERNLTALVRARGRLSLYVCTRVKKGDFFWWSLECWEMASCILKQGKQQGSAVGEESRQTSESSGGERALNRTQTWQLVHTNRQKHTRVQT